MDSRELSERSPLRVLDHSIHGGLGPGNLGVVCGAAGLGKSAFLVDVSLDELLRGRQVLHVALDQPPDRVRTYYDEIFRQLVRSEGVEAAADLWLQMERGLHIQAYVEGTFGVPALERTVALLESRIGLQPDLIVVDGYDWEAGDREKIGELKGIARAQGAKLWMSATVRGEDPFPSPMPRYASLVDVLLHLKADEGTVHLKLLKDHDDPLPRPVALDLNPTTLLLVRV